MTNNSIFRAFMLMAISLFVSATFVSCEKESGDDDNNTSPTGNSALVGKWEVGDSGAEYGSFEFTNDSKYIITQRVSSPPAGARSLRAATDGQQPVYIIIIFGDYSQLNNTGNLFELDLKEFGTISITLGNDGKSITVIVNGETYTASKTEEIPSTSNDKTDLLCHTWEFKEYTIIEDLFPEDEKEWLIREDGNEWKIKYEQEINAYGKGTTVTFTKAGTYFVSYPNDDVFNAQWEWENISKGTMKYWEEVYNDGGVVTVTVTATTLEVQKDYVLTKLVR
ncbi:MAG: hypothetical protein LBJ17_06330 [Dysgonamonadaceae bacterium]|jgi:hypothetical protein|nr:hypothetical protein [Dysgonamonadaceae bacterium]